MGMKKLFAILLGMLLIGLSINVFAEEARASSQPIYKKVNGLHQYGQFMSGDEVQACFDALDDTEIIEYIYNALLRREEEIELDIFDEPIYPDQLYTYFSAVINNHPDLYFVGSYYQYWIYSTGDIALLVPQYTMSETEIAQTQALIDEEVKKACSAIRPGMSDFDKILAVHDYFTKNYSYDYEHLRDDSYMRKYTMPGLLLDKMAVCQGYGLGFKYVMNKLGIECITVQSNAMNHLWNLVQLENGNWYHVDVTWDDPSLDIYGGGYTQSDYNTYEFTAGRHREYFMLSDSGIQKMSHYSYTPNGMARDKRYDEASMLKVTEGIGYENGNWYYMNWHEFSKYSGEAWIHKYNSTTGTDEAVFKIDDTWKYVASFGDVCEYDGKMLYNTASKIMIYDPETGVNKIAVDNIVKKGSGKEIYKLDIDNGNLVYTVASDYLGSNKTSGQMEAEAVVESTKPKIGKATVSNGNTIVEIANCETGVVCVVEYEGERPVAIKYLDAAPSVTFTGIKADKIYYWNSLEEMLSISDVYTVK